MKDIDFDELDRAVNSLIGGKTETVEPAKIETSAPATSAVTMPAPAVPAQSNTAPTPTISAPITQPVVSVVAEPVVAVAAQPELPVVEPVVVPAQPIVNAPQAPVEQPIAKPQTITRLVAVPYPPKPRPLITTPVAPPKPIPVNTFESLASKRSSGRFVDVVNPTSQTRLDPRKMTAETSETIKQMMSGVSELHEHAAPVIAPVVPVEPTPAPVIAAVPTPIINPAQAPIPTVVPAQPIDDDDDIEQINNFIDSAIKSTNKKLDEKPLFNDAKVEKRPLGAFNGSVAAAPTPIVATAQVGVSANLNISNPQLPPELQNDLLSIESDSMPEVEAGHIIDIPAIDGSMTEPAANNVAPQVAVTTPIQPQSGNVIAITPIVAPQAVETPTAPQMPVQTSITQQYQEKPSSTPTSSAPIYDPNAYHELEKKSPKSGVMMWVLRIVGLIVIGAGVGVVAFFFVLPNL